MKNSNTPHSSDNESENIHTPNTYVRSKARVFFVRHGESVECTGGIGSMPQSDNAPLNNKGIQQMQEAGVYLKIAGIRDGMSEFMYGHDTTRSVESVEVIANQLIDGNKIKKSKTTKLRTTKKGRTDEERIIENGKVFISTVELMKQIRERVNGHLEQGTTFILVGHRSNKSGIEEATGNIDEDLEISFDIKNGEIIERDIDANTGKYIDPKKHPETLFLNRGNYKEILESLKNIPQFETAITMFNKNGKIEYEKYPIWELQNDVNEYFRKNTELFGKYLDQSSPVHLRLFCLANLIEQKQYETIEKYYLSPECKSLATEEKELLLQNVKNEKIMRIFRRLFVSRQKLWKDEENELFTSNNELALYSQLKQSRVVYNRATELQGNSLDPLINTGKENGIIDRKLYYEEEEKESIEENLNTLKEKKIIQRDFNPLMFKKDGKYSKFIIRAHVGEGKSIYISELVKQLTQESEVSVKFAIAKNLKLVDISDLFGDKDTIVYIDALDEAGDEIKEEIKKNFISFEGRCILATRHSESFGLGVNCCKLYFYPLDSDKYIDSRFLSNELKATEVKKWIEQHELSSEVKGNPLLLNLIVLLASVSDEDKKWMDEYKILEFNQIKTKSNLYENVVRFVLAKHSKEIKNQDFDPDEDLTTWMQRLGEYAFELFSNNSEKNNKRYFDSHLSILFKSEENGEYNFIHKSFYEFFLARYLAKMEDMEGSQFIYIYRDEKMNGNWNEWREFRPVVLFYAEELIKSRKYDELLSFLGEDGLLKNDDAFGENFFLGLEILYRLPEEVRGINHIGNLLELYNSIFFNLDILEIKKRKVLIKKFLLSIRSVDSEAGEHVFMEHHKYYLYNCKHFPRRVDLENEFFLDLLDIGTPKAINTSIELFKMRKTKDDLDADCLFYLGLLKIGIPGSLENLLHSLDLYTSKDYCNDASSIPLYKDLLKINIGVGLKYAQEGATRLLKKGEIESATILYGEIAKFGVPNMLELYNKYSIKDLPVNDEQYLKHYINSPYIQNLLDIGTDEAIEEIIAYANNSIMPGSYYTAYWTFGFLIRTGNPKLLIKACEGAKTLLLAGDDTRANILYNQLLSFNNKVIAIEISSHIPFFDSMPMGRYYLFKLCEKLLSFNDHLILERVVNGTEILLQNNDTYSTIILYKKMVSKNPNNRDLILHILKKMELLLESVIFQSYVGDVYNEIGDTPIYIPKT